MKSARKPSRLGRGERTHAVENDFLLLGHRHKIRKAAAKDEQRHAAEQLEQVGCLAAMRPA